MAEGYIDSYYTRTLNENTERPALAETLETDVCIIGGGLAGIAVAMGLVERGHDVVVLESSRIGWAASGRNGGFVLSGFAAGISDVAKKIGQDNAKTLYRLTRDAQKLILKRIDDNNIKCDPVNGHLITSWYKDTSGLQKRVEYTNAAMDDNLEYWEADKVGEVCKTDRYYGGLFDPDSFHMHPLNYITGLAKAAESKGVRIFEMTEAIYSEIEGDVKTIKTQNGRVEAKQVVFCGSAYTNMIAPPLKKSCLPIATYVMVTEPLSDEKLLSAITKPYAIRDTRYADDYYRVLPDNRILWGGRIHLGKPPSNLGELLHQDMLKIYPQLEGVKAEVAWSGKMGYTVHRMPLIGKFHEGAWYCTNFGGNGVGPTTAGGEIIARAIAENDKTYELFAPFGFAYAGGILGPLVAKTVYHSWEVADKIGEIKNCLPQKAA